MHPQSDSEGGRDAPALSVAAIKNLIHGHFFSNALFAAVSSGILDTIHIHAPRADTLADVLNLDPDVTKAVTRALVALNIVEAKDSGSLIVTQQGRLLVNDGPLRPLLDLNRLLYNEYSSRLPQRLSGIKNDFWSALEQDPHIEEAFFRVMANNTKPISNSIVDEIDFPENGTVVDLGAGSGDLIRTCHLRRPNIDCIAFERAPLAELLKERLAGTDITVTAGDFFEPVPSAHIYLLKSVLHNWTDRECYRLLHNLVQNAPTGARVIVIERSLKRNPSDVALGHLSMAALFSTYDRSSVEIARLMSDAGFLAPRYRTTDNSFNIIEARTPLSGSAID